MIFLKKNFKNFFNLKSLSFVFSAHELNLFEKILPNPNDFFLSILAILIFIALFI